MHSPLLHFAFYGLDHHDFVLLLNRLFVGSFFAISGYHKLFNRGRHEQLVETLKACHIPKVSFCQWFVPAVELSSGLGVMSGILAPIAAMGMISILTIAILTDGPRRIREYQPIDRADALDDFLYLPESTYLVMALFIILLGTGKYSLQVLLFWYLGINL